VAARSAATHLIAIDIKSPELLALREVPLISGGGREYQTIFIFRLEKRYIDHV
jgi:hypothetical protein